MTLKTSLSIEENTLKQLKAIASSEGRSVSNLVNLWLEQYIRALKAKRTAADQPELQLARK